jgi:hypothetical protein
LHNKKPVSSRDSRYPVKNSPQKVEKTINDLSNCTSYVDEMVHLDKSSLALQISPSTPRVGREILPPEGGRE